MSSAYEVPIPQQKFPYKGLLDIYLSIYGDLGRLLQILVASDRIRRGVVHFRKDGDYLVELDCFREVADNYMEKDEFLYCETEDTQAEIGH